MATAKALIFTGTGKAEVKDLPVPKVSPGHVLVRVRAIAINPTDWKTLYQGEASRFGSRLGCDYAGEVVAAGAGSTFKKGDRVAGMTFGANQNEPESGAFSEYTLAKDHVCLKLPDDMSYEDAATLGVSVTTVGQGMYEKLKLPLPNKPAEKPFPVLIYGGSTATGIYAIKYAKLSGLTVIATSSPRNFELLKSIGADHVFDYKAPNVGAEIRKLTNNKLKYAWDCTGFGGAICAAALSDNEEGGKPQLGAIIPIKRELVDSINPAVEGPYFTLGYTAIGSDITGFGKMYGPDPESVKFAGMFWKISEALLKEGKLTALQPEVNRLGSGLEGIIQGMEELKNDRVSGSKLVYTL